MTDVELLRAQLRVAELEEQLIAAKESDQDLTALKLELREARRAYREADPTRGTATPDVIEASAQVEEL